MNTLIIYFSQTGGTARVAENIAAGVREETGQCDFMRLDKAAPQILSEYDLVGFGCPVFYYQEPFHVQHFIENLPSLEGKKWFVFCTHGSEIGNFFALLTGRLKQKGVIVIDYYDCYADIMIPFYPSPSFTSGHPDALDLEEARDFGRDVVKRCHMISDHKSPHIAAPKPVPESWVLGAEMMTRQYVGNVMPGLRLDMKKCTRCYVCQDECPVAGIDVDADPPRIQDPCIYCWRCVNICPGLAIEGKWEKLVSMAPANYARYRKSLDEASKRGEFRWLVDPETIDCADPLHKQRERKKGR